MTAIKIKKFRFISTRPIHYILLAIAILIVALLIGVSVANAMQISMLISDTRALRHEVAVLHREQEANRALIEGQALFQERIDSMALEDTGRVFSIEKYRQAMTTYLKVPLANLLPVWHTPKATKVKNLIFRDSEDTRSIDVISLNTRDHFVCYEQWSILGNEQDYRKCSEELRSFTGRSMYPPVGKWVFEKHEDQIKKAVMQSTAQQRIRSNHMTRSDIRESKTLL